MDEKAEPWALSDVPVYNPAFDVTPPDMITAYITDAGIIYPEEVRKGKLKELAQGMFKK